MISTKDLGKIAPNLKDPKLTLICKGLNEAMDKFGISTPACQAAFIAQVMHESGEGRYMAELASGEAYEGRKDLGNTQPGDGVKFKGRGLVQITGRANYAAISKDLGIDFIANPALLEQMPYAAMSAAWFWKTHNLSNVIAQLGNTKDAFEVITKKINGGLNGFEDRLKYWGRTTLSMFS